MEWGRWAGRASRWLDRARRWRIGRAATRVWGPQWQRSRQRVEIDITWACNLRCNNCNRSCQQAPTGEHMTLDQVEHFVSESVAAGVRWERIRVLGGEPTLHPQHLEILAALLAYRRDHSPDTVIELVSNGHGDKVKAALACLPPGVRVENTQKSSVQQPFEAFNVAPVDCVDYADADYSNGCGVTTHCGVGLTPYGWYPCAVAGGIDRIVGYDLGRRQLPSEDDDMLDQLDAFCRLCGSFRREQDAPVTEPVASSSWEAAYAAHRARPPRLSRYGADDVRS